MRGRIFSILQQKLQQLELRSSSFHSRSPVLQHRRGLCKGASLSSQDLEDAIKLSHIVTKSTWDPSSSSTQALQQSGLHLTSNVVAEVIDMHSDPVLALRVFIWATHQQGYLHDSISRNALANLWGHKQHFGSFLEICDIMHLCNSVMKAKHYLVLIKAYGWAKMADQALAAFRDLQQQGYAVSAFHYNAIFDVLVKEDRLKELRLLYEQMQDAGIASNLVTYALRMRGFCRAQHGEEAFKLFNEMTKKGLCPDLSTFGALIDAVCHMDRVQKVYQILFNLLNACSDLDPAYYHTLIERLCKHGQVDQAKKIMDQLKRKKVYPSSLVYNILAVGFCTVKKVHDAVVVVNKMMKHRFLPDVRTVNLVISQLLEQRKVTEALKFLDTVTDAGFVANIFTYDTLIEGLCKCRELQKALEIWNTLAKEYVPNVNSSCILIERLCHIRNFSKAQLVFSKIMEADCSHDILLDGFRILHSSLRAACKFDEAKMILQSMKEWRKAQLKQMDLVEIPAESVA